MTKSAKTMKHVLDQLVAKEREDFERSNPPRISPHASAADLRSAIATAKDVYYRPIVHLLEIIKSADDVHFKGKMLYTSFQACN